MTTRLSSAGNSEIKSVSSRYVVPSDVPTETPGWARWREQRTGNADMHVWRAARPSGFSIIQLPLIFNCFLRLAHSSTFHSVSRKEEEEEEDDSSAEETGSRRQDKGREEMVAKTASMIQNWLKPLPGPPFTKLISLSQLFPALPPSSSSSSQSLFPQLTHSSPNSPFINEKERKPWAFDGKQWSFSRLDSSSLHPLHHLHRPSSRSPLLPLN